ncbi:transposase [Acinetobacter sp.]|jgi:hypothetical protein|uniref:Transposase n=1 Tax=Acinetobacter bereziniae TaxID=106648 RepID=A0A833PBC3_ACIBZ|nr:transposase [Acinetobacter sp.]KAF1020415.1 MAG: hypothetical protein GAK29_03636 [Acinetobacter bereziniae]MDR0238339.1 transposase [Acinetobacter sp.]
MNLLNGWTIATAKNGDQIQVKIIPLKRIQNNIDGMSWVEVGKQIQLETGQECCFNLDGRSFYTGLNQLYKIAL